MKKPTFQHHRLAQASITPAELKKALARKGRATASKMGNIKVDTPDGKFDSKSEYERWCQLNLLQAGGHIKNLVRQVPYKFFAIGADGEPFHFSTYYADFEYDQAGQHVVEDCKGAITDTYRLKRKLMLRCYNIKIFESAPEQMQKRPGVW